jgi:hypothetical protein
VLTAGSTGGHFLVRVVDVNEPIIYAARLSRITAEVFPNVVNSCGNQLEVGYAEAVEQMPCKYVVDAD